MVEKQLKEKQKIELEVRRKISEISYLCRESVLLISAIIQVALGGGVVGFQREYERQRVEEFRQQVDELIFVNRKVEKDMRELKYELNVFQLEKILFEEKVRLLKEKLDEINNIFKSFKLELERKDQVEEGYFQQFRELGRQLD